MFIISDLVNCRMLQTNAIEGVKEVLLDINISVDEIENVVSHFSEVTSDSLYKRDKFEVMYIGGNDNG